MSDGEDPNVKTSNLNIAVVLEGEDSFWLCELANQKKPLVPGWKTVKAFWLYPFEGDVQRFATVKGFKETDSVFEIDRSAYSEILSGATIAVDIVVRSITLNGEKFGFVSYEEMKRVEEAYKAFLKRESVSIPNPTESISEKTQSTIRVKETMRAKKVEEEKPKTVTEEKPNTATGGKPKIPIGEKPQEHNSERRVTNRESGFSAPVKVFNPTVIRGTVYRKGTHCSTEAFHWNAYYIARKNKQVFVVPVESNIKYGFCVTSITLEDTSLFVLFETPFNSSEVFVSRCTDVVPVSRHTVLGPPGERILLLTTHHTSSTKRPRSEDDDGATKTFRDRPAIDEKPDSPRQQANDRSSTLSLVGFNKWSDAEGTLPPVSELSAQYPFHSSGSPTSGMYTAVLEDGVAVTYTSAIASKYNVQKSKRTTLGGNTPADADMRSLLENIQLAKELVKK